MRDLSPLWQELLAQQKADSPLSALEVACSRSREFFPLEDSVHQEVSALAEHLRKNPTFLENWGRFRSVFLGNRREDPFLEEFPAVLFPNIPTGLLLLLTALSLLSEGEENFRKQHLPLEQFRSIFQDLRNALREYREETGETGYSYDNAFAWFVLRLFTGEVLRFGRLEFQPKQSFSDILVFRNRQDRTTLRILIDGTFPVNEKGWRWTDGESVSFSVSPIQRRREEYAGCPLDDNGRISRERVTLPTDSWQCILAPGDPVWYMHIPSDGPLRPELVLDSLEQIRRFDQGKSKGVICSSWLFDPILPELLSPTSNLVRLQRMGLLLPAASASEKEMLRHVFGQKGLQDYHSVPWNTSLRKALGSYLDHGGNARGGRILFPDFSPVSR